MTLTRNRKLISLVILFFVSVIFWLLFVPGQSPVAKVIGLPGAYNIHQVFAPYDGPHPLLIKRPKETYPFPIKPGQLGPVKPLFAGALQYPYFCRTEQSGLGQPVVDNQDRAGVPIYKVNQEGDKTRHIIGYSKDCSIATRIHYYYKKIDDDNFYPVQQVDDDIEQISLNGSLVDFIIRVETGTINRHPYMISMLKGPEDSVHKADDGLWNKKLIYQFRGGVGIGKIQGRLDINKLLSRRNQQLAQGYAIIHSTANQTANHYDIWLSEDTALRVKKQFVSQFGEPRYTVGLGGSGGAIQQYLLGQNNPNILDAAVALYSYPDMITKTPHVLDCELMEYYFDVTDADNPKWSNWNNRQWIEGMNAIDGRFNSYTWITALANLLTGNKIHITSGKSECVESWRGLSPLILNPRYPMQVDWIAEDILLQSELNYWNSMKYLYGTDDQGHTNTTWDNVGVQYGLVALTKGLINIDEFLKLNARIGSWKQTREMKLEHFWFLDSNTRFDPSGFSVWSHHNMALAQSEDQPAPRAEGHIEAMSAAYRSGQVFMGKINIPVIDLRHYMENDLNMHHSLGSFSARARIIKAGSSIGNQVIWMTHKPHTPVPNALVAIDRWMQNIEQNPNKTVADNRPVDIMDSCFSNDGQLIAQGNDVWNGPWNQTPTGICHQTYPPFSTSRMMAGEDITGSILKCQLQSVDQAIESGLYHPINMEPYKEQLETIFPQGVCDYSKPDMGLPKDLFSPN